MSEKITKKDIQEAKAPDVVLVGATGVFDWIVERKNLLLGALAALIVVIGVASFVSSQSEKSRQAEGEKLSKALALVSRPVVEGSTGGESFPSLEAKNKAVTEALAALGSEGQGGEGAKLVLGRLDFEAGRYDDAIAKFESYLGSVKTGGLRIFVLETLGYAYEAKGDTAKATSTFELLGKEGAPARALYHRARLAEKAGQKDEARKLYNEVVAGYEKDIVAGEARSRLELLDVPAAGVGAFEKAGN